MRDDVFQMIAGVAGLSGGHCGEAECAPCNARVSGLKNLKSALTLAGTELMELLAATANSYDACMHMFENKEDKDMFGIGFVYGSVTALAIYRADAADLKQVLDRTKAVSLCSSKTLN